MSSKFIDLVIIKRSNAIWHYIFLLLIVLHLLGVPAFSQKPLAAGEVRQRGKIVNPHFDKTKCHFCHKEGKPKSSATAKRDKLCLSCHEDSRIRTELHPNKVGSHSGKVKKIPKDFPLSYGRLACITCHDSRIQCFPGEERKAFNASFLRGGPYAHPSSICYRCHSQEYYEIFDPHKQLDEAGKIIKESCLYCHKKPEGENLKDLEVGETIERICHNCHKGKTHRTVSGSMLNPDFKMQRYIRSVEKQKGLYLPLSRDKKIFCSTCHNPHEKGVFPEGDIRGIGSEGKKAQNQRLRVVSGNQCIVCHNKGYYGANRNYGY